MSEKDDDEQKSSLYRGPSSASPYPLSRMAPAFDLVNLANEIAHAQMQVQSVAAGKLDVIALQIRALQEQARLVLERARRDEQLHRARCSFEKRAGKVYHLYDRGIEGPYWSLLAPGEWRTAPPHPHLGSYRLEGDGSWTEVNDLDKRDQADALAQRLLGKPGA